MYQKVGAELK